MKTSQIARGIVGALSLMGVIGAVGCAGYDGEGAAGEGEIGETSQALGGTAPVIGSALTAAPTGLYGSASCVITHNGQEKMLVGGGFNLAGSAGVNSLHLYDPAGNTWTLLSSLDANDHLAASVGDLRAIKTASNKCLFIGGSTSEFGNAVANVDEVSVDGSNNFVVTAMTALTKPRARFAVSTCTKTDSGSVPVIMVFGGFDNALSAGQKELRSIEVSNDFDPNAAWSQNDTALVTGIRDFALVKNPADDQYFIAGGRTAAGAQTANTNVVTTSTACVPTATQFSTDDTGSVKRTLTSATEGNVAFLEGSTDVVLVAGGKTGASTLVTAVDQVAVNWATPNVAITRGAFTITGTYLPTLVQSNPNTGANTLAHQLIGGSNGAISASAVDVQQYQDSFGFVSASPAFAVGRYKGVAERLTVSGTAKVYAALGKDIGGAAVLTSTFPITP